MKKGGGGGGEEKGRGERGKRERERCHAPSTLNHVIYCQETFYHEIKLENQPKLYVKQATFKDPQVLVKIREG